MIERLNKDRAGAALLILLGGLVAYVGRSYDIGSFQSMGAGFMPATLGILMALVGLVLGLTSTMTTTEEQAIKVPDRADGSLSMRGWLCIIGGVAAFVVLGDHGGLAPATFASVFIAALGDRSNSVRHALLLAGAMVLLALLLFTWALALPFPAFQWR